VKNTNKWRMCVHYTDLNKHCHKDPFGLPCIDQVIDSTAGCDLLCFLNCYSGYHQIAIKEEDREKTVFITPFGAYFYTTMSFGLKMKDRNGEPERGGSEWEPIKILLEGDRNSNKMNTASNTRL
jgi:hypothetical protein